MSGHHRGGRSARRLANLEVLEARTQPSVTADFSAGLLTIAGDGASNLVQISDDGTAVTVVGDGVALGTFTGVTDVVVGTGGGNDQVFYGLEVAAGTTDPTVRRFEVGLGNGNDVFGATLTGDVAAGSVADFLVNGRTGDDSIAVDAAAFGLSAGSTATWDLVGDIGNDAVGASLGGRLDGDFVLRSFGGDGGDALSFVLAPETGSTGSVVARLNGGAGDDRFAVLIAGDPSGLSLRDVVVNGGAGDDLARARGRATFVSVLRLPGNNLGNRGVQLVGGHLFVTGGGGGDVIRIADGATVSVTSGGGTRTFVGVTDISVYTGNGADRVRYNLAAASAGGPVQRRVFGDLGRGDDRFGATLTGRLPGGSVVGVRVAGNTGDDVLSLGLSPGAGSTGSVAAHLDGDGGSDHFVVAVAGDTGALASLDLFVDGGDDTDSGVLDDVVTAVNVENVS
jgi:hypothetical protein